jgi:hypothetical protein
VNLLTGERTDRLIDDSAIRSLVGDPMRKTLAVGRALGLLGV